MSVELNRLSDTPARKTKTGLPTARRTMRTAKRFAVRDGRLITGQKQYSGRATAQLVLQAPGV